MTFTMRQPSGTTSPNAVTVRRDGSWLTAEMPVAARCKTLALSCRGLWKRHGKRAVFEVPASVVEDFADTESDDTYAAGIERLLSWCEASLSGEVPAGWTAPTDAELRALVPANAWSIQAGAHVRQIDLNLGATCSAVRVALIGAVPEALSKSRRVWLKGLIDYSSDHRRFVRLGLSSGAQRTSIIAEVDLTGCPRQWYAALTPLSLAALRHVTVEMLATLTSLCDPHVCCDTWEQSLT